MTWPTPVFGQLDRLNSRAAARATLDKGATHPSEIWSAGKDLGWNGLRSPRNTAGRASGLAELGGGTGGAGPRAVPRAVPPDRSGRRSDRPAARRIPFVRNCFQG